MSKEIFLLFSFFFPPLAVNLARRWDVVVTSVLCAKEQCNPCSECNEPRSNKQSWHCFSGLGVPNPDPISMAQSSKKLRITHLIVPVALFVCDFLFWWCFALCYFKLGRLRQLLFHMPLLTPSLTHQLQSF